MGHKTIGSGCGGSGESRHWLRWRFSPEKLHHEYYWLLAGAGRRRGDRPCAGPGRREARRGGGRRGRGAALALRVPGALDLADAAEWNGLEAAAAAVARTVPRDAWVVAPEALLFQADRRGCRMEWTTPAARASGRRVGSRTTRSKARSI